MALDNPPKTIFSRIVDREIPAVIVYEDNDTMAFLDHNPVSAGHLLVIPKITVDHLDDCSPETYAAIFKTVYLVSKQIKNKLQPERVALVVHGYDVPHAHVHVIPSYDRNDLAFPKRPSILPTTAELQAVAESLKYKSV